MSNEVDAQTIQKTQKSLGKFIKKPTLTDKLLKKPPFRFLHDVVTNVIRETGFLKGLYSERELVSENVKEKDDKMAFLNKLIDAIKAITGLQLAVRASRMIAGIATTETNLLLQAIATALDKKLDSSQYIAKLKSDKTSKNQTNAQLTEKKTKHEKSKDKPEKKEEKKKPSTTTTQKPGRTTDRSKGTKVLASKASVESVRKEEVNIKAKTKKVKEKLVTPKENKSNTSDEKRNKKIIEENNDNVNDLIKKASIDELKEDLKKIDVEPINLDNGKPELNDYHENVIINNDNKSVTEVMPESYSTNEQPDNVPMYNDVVPPIRLNSARTKRSDDEEIVKTSRTIDEEIVKTSRTSDEEIVKTSRTIDEEILPEFTVIKETRMERVKSARPRTGKTATIIDKEAIQPIQPQLMESTNNNLEKLSVRPRSSLRPPSVRPSSARPGAPRLRNDATLPEGEIVPLGKVNVILESYNNKDLDEEETVTIQTAPEPDYQTPILQLPTDKGHLVEQILEQIQQSDVVEHTKPTVNIEWEQDGFRSRNAANKEIEQLKAAIQTLTRTANPLGKLVNYLHEDIEAMHSELDTWVNSARQIMADVANQKRISDESNKPLQAQLEEIEENIVKHQQQIVSVHGNILRNEQRIRDLLVK